ncbi:uncharacterized protein LOC144355129 [Saccoglossus kowalevskii]
MSQLMKHGTELVFLITVVALLVRTSATETAGHSLFADSTDSEKDNTRQPRRTVPDTLMIIRKSYAKHPLVGKTTGSEERHSERSYDGDHDNNYFKRMIKALLEDNKQTIHTIPDSDIITRNNNEQQSRENPGDKDGPGSKFLKNDFWERRENTLPKHADV